MGKILFACDIDNTLIYSAKHPHIGWSCVEWIHGNEQAYMSPKTSELLKKIYEDVIFIPITSRSTEQYLRISWPKKAIPHYAITAHGARLLSNFDQDTAWMNETMRTLLPWQCELQRMLTLLSSDSSFIRSKIVDESYLFVYCNSNVDPTAIVEKVKSMTTLRVCLSGKKIYLFPPGLSKGAALNRLRFLFPQYRIISAGDSEMDADMLNCSDYAIFPKELLPIIYSFGSCCPPEELFSEFVLETLLKILKG